MYDLSKGGFSKHLTIHLIQVNGETLSKQDVLL